MPITQLIFGQFRYNLLGFSRFHLLFIAWTQIYLHIWSIVQWDLVAFHSGKHYFCQCGHWKVQKNNSWEVHVSTAELVKKMCLCRLSLCLFVWFTPFTKLTNLQGKWFFTEVAYIQINVSLFWLAIYSNWFEIYSRSRVNI